MENAIHQIISALAARVIMRLKISIIKNVEIGNFLLYFLPH